MKIKLLKLLMPVICMIVLGTMSINILAQGNSAGCAAWNSIGTRPLNASNFAGMNSQAMLAGEVLRVTFTLNSGVSADVRLTVSGLGTQQTILASGSTTLAITIPSNGNYAASARNNGPSNVTASYSCSAVTGAGNSAVVSNPADGFGDGRINRLDAAAPIVVYPYSDDTGLGFDIYTAEGDFIMRATGADLQFLPIVNAERGIIISDIVGEGYQVSAPQYNGKTYILQFPRPLSGVDYVSWEQD